MRHIVNFGLLFMFIALVATGVMAFTRPFSLSTTEVHIIAGFVTTLLVILHLSSRIPYFRKNISGSKKAPITKLQLATIILGATLLIIFARWQLPPVSWIVNQSYETRNRAHIVRSSSLTGFGKPSAHQTIVRREAKDPKSCGLSLYLSFPEDLTVFPSVAVWAETTAGTMIETLYLQQSLAYSDKPVWHGVKTQRNHILPVWRHRYTMVSGINPDGEKDVVSGATESHSYALDPYLVPGEENKFIIAVEINSPKDPNETWTDEIYGQPSLIYTAYIKLDEEKPYYLLELTGHGGGRAEDSGNIQYDLDGMTTAKSLADLFLIKIERN